MTLRHKQDFSFIIAKKMALAKSNYFPGNEKAVPLPASINLD
jgi:hypothetical protein